MKIHEYNEMMAYLTRPGMKTGGRIGFAKAGLADPANNVVKGQELGDGIQQKLNPIRYTAQHGATTTMKDRGGMLKYKTLKEAKDRRAQLIKKFGEIDKTRPEVQKYTWENFSKDPEFEEFFKKEITENPNIKAVAKKYNLGEDNLEELFNKVRDEVRISERAKPKKGTIYAYKGEKPLINTNTLMRLNRKFNFTYKPRLGTVGTKELAKYMDMSEREVTKLMSYIDKSSPDPLYAKTKAGIWEEGAIKRANKFRDRLKELGIDFFQPAADPIRVRSDLAGKGSKGKWRFRANPEQLEELGEFRIFKKAGEGLSSGKKNIFSALSRQSDEYKKFGYSKDRTAVSELASTINRSFDAMSDSELKNFIKKNPKLRHLVEMTFDGITGDFGKVSIDKMSNDQIRQFVKMNVEHIRGRSTVKFDDATKKILDGLDIEYPRNLYIVPNGINVSVKQKVESFIADFPNKTEKIKNINKVFKDAEISYWNRNTNSYGGYKPKKSATDITHLQIEVGDLLKKYQTYTGADGKPYVIIKNKEALFAKLKNLAELRGESADTIQKYGQLIRESTKNIPTKRGQIAAGIAVGVLAPVLTGLGIDQVEAAEPGQMPQGSPGQLSEDEEGLGLGETAAIGAGAAVAAKPAWKYLAKPALKIMGSPAAGLAFGGWSFVDKFNASKAETEEGKVYDALTEGIKLGEGEDQKEILGSQVGMELLFPEVVKRGAKKLGVEFSKKGAQNALAALGRFALNPIGRAASIMTPTGLTLNAAAVAKRYYDFAKDEMGRLEQMKPEERKAYNEMLMDETYSADAGDYYTSKDVLAGKPVGYNQGGRVGFDEGSKPKNPGRRTFIKGITALAALPLVGRFFKLGKVLERASGYTGPAIEKIKGMPEWFPGLVKKLWNEGEDVTKTASWKDRQIVKRGTLEGGDDVDMIYDLDTGDVSINVTPKKGKYETTSGAYNKEYGLDYTKGQADEMTKGKKPPDEFGVTEIEGRMDPGAADIDWDVNPTTVDDAMSDLTELEAFAKSKSTKQIHKKKGTKPKDVFPDYDYDPLDDY